MSSENTWILWLFIVAFIGFAVYGLYSKAKRKSETWNAVVIDKSDTERVDSPDSTTPATISVGTRQAVNHDYTLKLKADDGHEFEWPVGEGFYASVQVGDRLQKPAGTETPFKVV